MPGNVNKKDLIQIESDLFEYILTKSIILFELTKDTQELVQFIIDSINDASHIKADKEELMKIIDISVKSAMRFNGIKNDRKTKIN